MNGTGTGTLVGYEKYFDKKSNADKHVYKVMNGKFNDYTRLFEGETELIKIIEPTQVLKKLEGQIVSFDFATSKFFRKDASGKFAEETILSYKNIRESGEPARQAPEQIDIMKNEKTGYYSKPSKNHIDAVSK
jgi:hypothetical protein